MKQVIAALLILISSMARAELTLEMDEKSVAVGQSFRLVLIEENGDGTANLDLAPLKADFNILGTARSTNYSIINNEAHSTRQWTIILQPKRAGTLTIPPLTVGQDQTRAATIEVTSAKDSSNPDAANEAKDVMLRGEVSKEQPFVNEQVIYTVKLYVYNNRRLLDSAFQAPTIEDGLLISLGDARRYQEMVQGRYYSVEEQKYAIFPQKSGAFAIKPPSFRALIYEDIPQQVNIQAPAVTLSVQAAPSSFKGNNWLPAKHLVLTETRDQSSLTLEQGDTLMRKITMEATGLPAQLMPALAITEQDGVRVYQDKPEERNILRQGNVVGNTSINVTYLFNKPGQVRVAPVQLTWFNTDTGKEETTILPELNVNVTPAPGNTTTQPGISDTPATTRAETGVQAPAAPVQQSMAWWLVGGLILAWGLTLQQWWRQRNGSKTKRERPQGLRDLKSACAANQAEQAQKALLHWAREQWPQASILNLNDITRLTNSDTLNRHIDALSEALYQAGASTWNGQDLWQAIGQFKPAKDAKKARQTGIPPANPKL